MAPGDGTSEYELHLLCAQISNLYVRKGLSPPTQLPGAVKHWLGLSHGEIIEVARKHFDEHRRLYTSGSGDGLFYMSRQRSAEHAGEAKA